MAKQMLFMIGGTCRARVGIVCPSMSFSRVKRKSRKAGANIQHSGARVQFDGSSSAPCAAPTSIANRTACSCFSLPTSTLRCIYDMFPRESATSAFGAFE